jgi:hypothetical protein
MNVQLDLILPPIIVGMLILMIMGVNQMMMESQIGNRLNIDMQNFANSTMVMLQENLRDVQDVVAISDSTLTYTSATSDTVRIERENRDLLMIRRPVSGATDTLRFNSNLADIRFTLFLLAMDGPTMLRVRIETESAANMQISTATNTYRAFAERDFYLRNLDLIAIP